MSSKACQDAAESHEKCSCDPTECQFVQELQDLVVYAKRNGWYVGPAGNRGPRFVASKGPQGNPVFIRSNSLMGLLAQIQDHDKKLPKRETSGVFQI